MAVISKFVHGSRVPKLQPTEVICHWTAAEVDGRKLLQLDTYGSQQRQIPGKQSQTLQLDKRGAGELFEILKAQFDFQ